MVSHTEKKSIGEPLTIENGVPLGEILTSGDTRVSVCRELRPEEAHAIFKMIKEGFAEHNAHSASPQDMTQDEFIKEAGDRSVLKYLARGASSNELQGYLSVHTNMDDIVWYDPDKLKERQNAFAPNEQAFYVGTFIVPENLRGFRVSGALLEAALIQLVNFNRQNGNSSLCFFDRSDSGSTAMKEYVQRKMDYITQQNGRFLVTEFDRIYSESNDGEQKDIQHFYEIRPPR